MLNSWGSHPFRQLTVQYSKAGGHSCGVLTAGSSLHQSDQDGAVQAVAVTCTIKHWMRQKLLVFGDPHNAKCC